jgi:hypothetical protein
VTRTHHPKKKRKKKEEFSTSNITGVEAAKASQYVSPSPYLLVI